MINNLWRCFETTGHVHTYLGYKDYETTRQQQMASESMPDTLNCDVIDEANQT